MCQELKVKRLSDPKNKEGMVLLFNERLIWRRPQYLLDSTGYKDYIVFILNSLLDVVTEPKLHGPFP